MKSSMPAPFVLRCWSPWQIALVTVKLPAHWVSIFRGLASTIRHSLCWKPYSNSHLDNYRRAETTYEQVTDTLWNDTIEFLNQGNAPDSFYEQYEAADEVGQNDLVNEVYNQRFDESRAVADALANYQRAAKVVPVVLDLGIVRLGLATRSADTNERQQHLAAAESLFLSVKGYAGDTDDYQLYLGQVYYWLGKVNDGDELFNALINKYERSPYVLASVSDVLRDLGATERAVGYIDEAYETGAGRGNAAELCVQAVFVCQLS